MNKILSILVATALTGATVSPARADKPNVVNGKPCVAEVCVGDYLKNLGNINWISVDARIAPYKKLPITKGKVVGSNSAIAAFEPYLDTFSMDKKGITAASKVKLCKISHLHGLQGTYLSKSGNKVAVEFQLLPFNDGKSQEFYVSSITTTLANTKGLSADRINEVRGKVAQKYGRLQTLSIGEPSVGIEVNNITGSSDLEIQLQYTPGLMTPDIDRQLGKYPGCPVRKINID